MKRHKTLVKKKIMRQKQQKQRMDLFFQDRKIDHQLYKINRDRQFTKQQYQEAQRIIKIKDEQLRIKKQQQQKERIKQMQWRKIAQLQVRDFATICDQTKMFCQLPHYYVVFPSQKHKIQMIQLWKLMSSELKNKYATQFPRQLYDPLQNRPIYSSVKHQHKIVKQSIQKCQICSLKKFNNPLKLSQWLKLVHYKQLFIKLDKRYIYYSQKILKYLNLKCLFQSYFITYSGQITIRLNQNNKKIVNISLVTYSCKQCLINLYSQIIIDFVQMNKQYFLNPQKQKKLNILLRKKSINMKCKQPTINYRSNDPDYISQSQQQSSSQQEDQQQEKGQTENIFKKLVQNNQKQQKFIQDSNNCKRQDKQNIHKDLFSQYMSQNESSYDYVPDVGKFKIQNSYEINKLKNQFDLS